MASKQVAIMAGCLGKLGHVDLSTIEGRMDAQKRVYLLQVAGIQLGYQFSWDIYGPFSRGLATDLIAYRGEKPAVDALLEELTLKRDAADMISAVKRVIDQGPELRIEQLKWLELLTSLHHLAVTSQGLSSINEVLTSQELRSRLTELLFEHKPHLADARQHADQAVQLLANLEATTAPAA